MVTKAANGATRRSPRMGTGSLHILTQQVDGELPALVELSLNYTAGKEIAGKQIGPRSRLAGRFIVIEGHKPLRAMC